MTTAVRWSRLAVTIGVCLGLALVLATCGSGSDEGGDTEGSNGDAAAVETRSGRDVRVGYVVDGAGLKDGGFNQLGAEGLARAADEFGIEPRAVVSDSPASYRHQVAALAEAGFDLVIVAGFNLIEAVAEASREYPETEFAITDIPVAEVPGAGESANVRGLPFDQEPAGLLAGYLAGLMALERAGEGAVVGAVGGQRIPPVASWLRGFEAGLAEASPSLELRTAYSDTFVKPRPCLGIVRDQIAAGAQVIFEAAGPCGVAAIELAGRRGVLAIGTDGDYAELGDHVLASGLKRTDIAVFETIKDYLRGDFRGGEDRLFTIADGGVGLSELSDAVPPRIREQVEVRAAELAAEDLG